VDQSIRLLHPATNTILPERSAHDLGVDDISRSFDLSFLSEHRIARLLAQPVADTEEILSRQSVFRDLRRHPKVCDAFRSIIPKIDELSAFATTRRESDSVLEQTIWRLGELELFTECVDILATAFAGAPDLSSERLAAVAARLAALQAGPDFVRLRTELPAMRRGLLQRQSLTLGVNLDERLRPVEVAVLSINAERFHERSIIGRLFGKAGSYATDSTIFATPLPPEITSATRGKIPLSPLFQELEQLIGDSLRPVQRTLRSYVDVNTGLLNSLRGDAAFFLGAIRLAERLESGGIPVCIPDIVHTGNDNMDGMVNLHLAIRYIQGESEQPVPNNVSFRPDAQFSVLTGPNQGGKTTFTQGVGIVYLLAQNGLFVPARSARLRPADRIETHFPSAESGSLDTGRLSEETTRLSGLIDVISDRSIVLLNESLSSTGPQEAGVLAEELLRVFSAVGVRGVFATHLHGLARSVCEDRATFSGVSSLVAEADISGDHAFRTFRIREGSPDGSSFARDIALRHGLSYEQMIARLAERGIEL
jgi:hypothetical protein